MSSRKQFHKLAVHGEVSRRNSTVGGTVIGDYMQDGGRTLVIEMPKVEKKPASSKRKKAAATAATNSTQGQNQQPVAAGV
jgi:hypothetical protein